MNQVISIIYALFLVGSLLVSFFIVFHLAKYSVNQRFARATILFFCIGTFSLLLLNIALFFSLPTDTFSSFLPSQSSSSKF